MVIVETLVETEIPTVRDKEHIVIHHNRSGLHHDGCRLDHHRRGLNGNRAVCYRRSDADAHANVYLRLGVRRGKVHNQNKSKSCEYGFPKHS